MKSRTTEGDWRLALGRVPYVWNKNHWILKHRLGPQEQQTRAALDAPCASGLPATAVARVGPSRRQRAAENEWENEGGATQAPMLAPGHGKCDE